jgi:hypothetical protein
MSVDLFLAGYIAGQMESCADWRKRKAEEHPGDATRNFDCSGELLEMSKRLRMFIGGPWYERYLNRAHHQKLSERMTEALNLEMGSIHFTEQDPETLFKHLVEASGVEPRYLDD